MRTRYVLHCSFMLGNVHSQLYELSYRGTRYGTSRKREQYLLYIQSVYVLQSMPEWLLWICTTRASKARDIITKDAIMNALTVDMALGCSTNSMLHLPAIAHEIGFDFDISFANPISERTPNLCHLAPAGNISGGLKRGRRRVGCHERAC